MGFCALKRTAFLAVLSPALLARTAAVSPSQEVSSREITRLLSWELFMSENRNRGAIAVKLSRIFNGSLASAAYTATDLRHRTDRPRRPFSRLPLPADQPAPYRDMRYFS